MARSHSRSAASTRMSRSHRKNIATNETENRSPIHGCRIRAVGPPPTNVVSQKSRGCENARPVSSRNRKDSPTTQCTTRSTKVKRWISTALTALLTRPRSRCLVVVGHLGPEPQIVQAGCQEPEVERGGAHLPEVAQRGQHASARRG